MLMVLNCFKKRYESGNRFRYLEHLSQITAKCLLLLISRMHEALTRVFVANPISIWHLIHVLLCSKLENFTQYRISLLTSHRLLLS